MAIASVNFAIFVSSRVNDPRVAEQISGVMIVPILALVFAQLAGLIVINVLTMLSFIGGMALAGCRFDLSGCFDLPAREDPDPLEIMRKVL